MIYNRLRLCSIWKSAYLNAALFSVVWNNTLYPLSGFGLFFYYMTMKTLKMAVFFHL